MLDEILVGLAEWTRAEEAGVGGEWRGVRGFDHAMAGAVYVRDFVFGVVAPEDEYEVFAIFGEAADHGIGELLPSLALMRSGFARLYRECGVE